MSETAPSGADWTADLELIRAAAVVAGETALGYFRKGPDVRWKNEGRSPVSEADLAANDVLKTRLLAARPDYGWLSEETDDDQSRLSRDTVFVVDPIDGTRAFIAGKELWCVSVAVVHRGQPVAGILYAPALDELFEAGAGRAALRNGTPISVREAKAGETLHLAAAEDTIGKFAPAYRSAVARVPHVPSLAYRLAMVADGRIDGTLVKRNSHDWDLAAADLILAEAGGALVDLDGKALSYNRSTVIHGVLCAAARPLLPGLIAASRSLEPH
ncbi:MULTISPECIES: 3'(2'),5'-bisphosphate nucleotidase CysQ [unclassified Ensifer]|uniref:3'(2'),5'-bisphosphate nucleotidase CysQ n=1 Tax=unclassified Ensifer TaxID=2633371 RepID=UPI0008139CDD|nr:MULTISPECIES: 3'(2'),5'-bisphosphate nucleotidase CysQ [unclassified Ensifer]OCP00243.1 3'(2'),5'-bisphosphate nucleotidase CysQ [Ensifer sp. LC14]OCP07363.1 3'(2'),5'-bisphosphate nucleotidase CysQ [Ensifer sp. LC11]OCP08056.1 3'(2'),5'-bisphosphate nucleotidase CysQ [Ensifer sp. LC13]OCP31892.1 3'(2'),5'-bisphosphate nucleotidase CysQ [Ensifer sp. LC499]